MWTCTNKAHTLQCVRYFNYKLNLTKFCTWRKVEHYFTTFDYGAGSSIQRMLCSSDYMLSHTWALKSLLFKLYQKARLDWIQALQQNPIQSSEKLTPSSHGYSKSSPRGSTVLTVVFFQLPCTNSLAWQNLYCIIMPLVNACVLQKKESGKL